MKPNTCLGCLKLLIIVFIFTNEIFAQTSIKDLESINTELDKFKSELTDIEMDKKSLSVDTEDKILDAEETLGDVTIEPIYVEKESIDFYFGYDYFNKEVDFFDNVPIPFDYILGPGDEIIISLWGEMNSRESFLINKNGQIFYEGIGFINISNRTILIAEEILSRELGKIYSTLQKNEQSTSLSIELGRLKSLNIYFSGLVNNPGISLVHPFSDIFTALIQSGGVDLDGSLRTIEIIRNNSTVANIDLYDFFNNGNKSNLNYKLMDGDVIHVPPFNKRVKITGSVKRPGYYETLVSDSLYELIQYAAGLNANAASTGILIDTIVPIEDRMSDDNASSSKNVNFKDSKNIALNDGDVVNIRKFGKVDTKVQIFGRVKSPGYYSSLNSSLKDILDIAGGFNDPTFRKTIQLDNIIVLRKNEKDFYAKEFSINYDDSQNFELNIDDKIFVYENTNYRNSFVYTVKGEVNRPGTYHLKDSKTTVREALELVGGLTALSSTRNISLIQEYTEINDEGLETTITEEVNNLTLDFVLGINSVLTASPKENVVRVDGNVYNPGLITYIDGATLPRYIELAGGHMPNSLKRKIYIKRANGNIEQNGRITLGLGKRIYPGDTVIVPLDPNPSEFDITAFIADLSTTLANIAAIFVVLDRVD